MGKNSLDDQTRKVVVNGSYSAWRQVTSLVPQGSVLQAMLSKTSVSDLNKARGCNHPTCEDDTKLWGPVNTHKGWFAVQRGLSKRVEWSDINPRRCSQDKSPQSSS